MSDFISAANIIANNLTAPNPPKAITITNKSTGKSETYTRTYLSYNYATPKGTFSSEALFELQICKGKVKRNKKGDIKLNLSISDQTDLAGLGQLSLGFAYVVQKYKAAYGQHKFDPITNPGDLRGAFFLPAVEGTGEIIEGASPIVSLKMNEKTKFKVLKPKINLQTGEPIMYNGSPDYEEEPIDYLSLIDKSIDCSVVFNARDLYRSTGVPLPQMFVRSCMILNISDSGEVEHTKSEMVRDFLMKNPEALNTLAEQIAKLKTGVSTAPSLLTMESSKTEAPKTESPPINLPSVNTQQQPQVNQFPQVNTQQQASSPAPIITTNQQSPMNQLNNGLPGLSMPMPQVPLNTSQYQLPMTGIQQGGLDLTALLNSQQQQGVTLTKLS